MKFVFFLAGLLFASAASAKALNNWSRQNRYSCVHALRFFFPPWASEQTRELYFRRAVDIAHYEKIRNELELSHRDFFPLVMDPAHRNQVDYNSIEEGKTGVLAIRNGVIKGPLTRGPKEIEFYDSNGYPWDVKSPRSPLANENWQFNIGKIGESILSQVRTYHGHLSKNRSVEVGVLINHRNLVDEHLLELISWLTINVPKEKKKLIHFVPPL